jgi:hypothetical protein
MTAFEPEIHLERLQAGTVALDTNDIDTIKQEYLNGLKEILPNTKVEFQKADHIDTEAYSKLLNQFFWSIDREKSLDNFQIDRELQDVLKTAPNDYVIVGSLTGFSRSGGSLALGIAKGVLMGILTLGMFYTVPVGSNANINLAVIDKTKMKVIYFDRKEVEDSPREYEVIRSLEKKIFKNYIARN